MSSTIFQIVSVVAGLAVLATAFFIFIFATKGLAKGLAVTVSLAVFAALLLNLVRSFGP